MDDSCAVCAEPLQWVAYGPCGHREVCSTCVVRMRFICEDRHCCLCKSEARIIFITKALGDYTRMINDFTMFSADPREGQVGMYWYHEGTQAYFDDVDQYKMVKAMCKLSCSACDKRNEWSEGVRGKGDYMNVELLKIHLAQRHRLSMCSLCLEGRKVFICEQKLYTKAQLDQHIRSGDSEVDGSETERGGFMGHPICQFCEMPYYGENELYSHMQTGHYMCHICQKQHPGKYEYYKNYDDLEIHFRLSHFLCEDRDCLEKKFVVFTNESEMKRHNALEHGGKMSRAQRSAALQIPVSFQFRQPSYQDRRRGRRFNSDSTSDQFPQESRGTHETSDPRSFRATSPNARAISNQRELQTSSFGLAGSFELLNVLEGESSSVHPRDIRSSSTISTQLEASSFPPLPAAPSKNKKKNKNVVGGGMSGNAPVSRLHQNNRNISQAWSTPHGPPKSLIQSFPQLRPVSNPRPLSSSSLLSISSGNHQIRSTPRNTNSSSSSSSGSRTASVVQTKPHEVLPSTAASSSRKLPNLLGRGSFEDPILAARSGKPATGNQVLQKSEDVKAANKSLVERVRLALAYDENSYASFKKVSSQFRHGVINTEEYLAWVCQFGLSHLVLELAKLCPDLDKQRELIETYKFNTGKCILNECGSGNKSSQSKNQRSSNKGKEKCEDNEGASINNRTSGIKDLKSNGTTDGLLTNGHQSAKAKGKAKAVVEENGTGLGSQATEWKGLSRSSGTSRGGNKPPPKVSKFLKNRLGDAAAASLHSELNEEDKDPPEVLPVSGAWQNGGGRKLLAMTQKDRKRR